MRIQLDGPLELRNGSVGVRHGEAIQQRGAAQKRQIGLDVVAALPQDRFGRLAAKPCQQHIRNLRANIVLDREQIADLPIEPLRPERFARGRIDEFDADAQLLPVALHAAFDEIGSLEPGADLS